MGRRTLTLFLYMYMYPFIPPRLASPRPSSLPSPKFSPPKFLLLFASPLLSSPQERRCTAPHRTTPHHIAQHRTTPHHTAQVLSAISFIVIARPSRPSAPPRPSPHRLRPTDRPTDLYSPLPPSSSREPHVSAHGTSHFRSRSRSPSPVFRLPFPVSRIPFSVPRLPPSIPRFPFLVSRPWFSVSRLHSRSGPALSAGQPVLPILCSPCPCPCPAPNASPPCLCPMPATRPPPGEVALSAQCSSLLISITNHSASTNCDCVTRSVVA